MASAARNLQYNRTPMVNGSLAYDLEWAVREGELRHAGEAPRHQEIVQPKPKVRTAERAKVREKQRISLFPLVGFSAVVVMTLMALMSYIQLTVVSAEIVTLKSELAALETANVTLTAEYEQMFDMATIQEAAIQAGMSKPSGSQIYYLDLSGADSAVVYQQEEPSVLSRLLTSVNHGVYTVVEYFE